MYPFPREGVLEDSQLAEQFILVRRGGVTFYSNEGGAGTDSVDLEGTILGKQVRTIDEEPTVGLLGAQARAIRMLEEHARDEDEGSSRRVRFTPTEEAKGFSTGTGAGTNALEVIELERLVETEKTCIARLRDLLMKSEKHMAEHDLRLVDRTSQVVEMKTLEALAQPGLVARVALCGELLAAKQQIGEQVNKSEAELLGRPVKRALTGH